MAQHHGQLAFLGAVGGEGKVVGDLGRLAVLVGAQHADVEVVAREVEIVRIAAEESDGFLRREHQARVLEAVVLVQIVNAAVIQIDHVAAGMVLIGADALGLDLRLLGFLRLAEGGALQAAGDLLHPRGDVADLVEPVQLDGRAQHLVLLLFGIEAGGDVVALRGGKLLHALAYTMVVGQHQAIGRDEGAGATAGQAQRRVLRMLHPGRVRREPVACLQILGRQLVQRPHAFGGMTGSQRQQRGDNNESEPAQTPAPNLNRANH